MGNCNEQKLTVALVGNPNVGKSTLFNCLTGMRQHTGNWPGKTVGIAQGTMIKDGVEYLFTDLPGTYSLDGVSEEEQIAGDYIRSRKADCTVIVCDGSCLERSLILALQVLQICHKAVVCVNLMDEAQRHGLSIDAKRLERYLSAPVVMTAAGKGVGIESLLKIVRETADNMPPLQEKMFRDPVAAAEAIARDCVARTGQNDDAFHRRVDRLMVSRRFGVPLMFLLFFGILWLTVWGANYPSMLLEYLFSYGYGALSRWLSFLPQWLQGMLLNGIYVTCTRVIAVMLPPMAIFFPLVTILEDIGYLPRMAFLLDPCMACCGGCGKQALTLCMGLGCNAVGVMGCRIIDSPRERLIAILTNAMVPCNGRFPTLIVLSALFFPNVGSALVVASCVALGVAGAMVVSAVLTRTAFRSKESTFIMEIPPFRRPRLGQILTRSLFDRTLFVAGRALTVAAPAGTLLWLLSKWSLLSVISGFLDPAGVILGMNGVILLGFLLSLPANELLLPVVLMSLAGTQGIKDVADESLLLQIMTWKTAACTMVFTLFHWPCSTTLMTIYQETKSIKKTAAAFLLPTAVGCMLCLLLNWLL